tara:strand:+ start:50228 stop:50590 length:363 start_codon:yes stop_codon:yes gene_type:complete
MRTTAYSALLAASLALGVSACSEDSKENVEPADASAQSADASGSAADAQPGVDAQAQAGSDAMPQAAVLGERCGQDAEGLSCGAGLACCYPCGIQGCEFTCTEACTDDGPGCVSGCTLFP